MIFYPVKYFPVRTRGSDELLHVDLPLCCAERKWNDEDNGFSHERAKTSERVLPSRVTVSLFSASRGVFGLHFKVRLVVVRKLFRT